MQLENAIQLLQQHSQAIAQLTEDVMPEQAVWKPSPDSWSMLEVMCHLADEEREDFRARLMHILNGTEAPQIDPQTWIIERGYNQRELAAAVQGYLAERKASLAWLRSLNGADMEKSYADPAFPLRAGDMLSAWVAHDLLHLRQLIELRYAWLQQQMQPYSVDYAGDW